MSLFTVTPTFQKIGFVVKYSSAYGEGNFTQTVEMQLAGLVFKIAVLVSLSAAWFC
jgi:hypothetical protein